MPKATPLWVDRDLMSFEGGTAFRAGPAPSPPGPRR